MAVISFMIQAPGVISYTPGEHLKQKHHWMIIISYDDHNMLIVTSNSSGSTVVENSPHYPKIEGSSPIEGREKLYSLLGTVVENSYNRRSGQGFRPRANVINLFTAVTYDFLE